MAKRAKRFGICLDWKTILMAVVIIVIAWGVYKMATYPQPDQLPPHECASSADCSTGYVCFIHRFCGTPSQPTACVPFLGVLKWHKACNFNSDCPTGQACDTRVMWVGDTGTGISMCFDVSLTCQDYCQKQPHIMCVGHWNISGEYPDCNCQYLCDEGGPI